MLKAECPNAVSIGCQNVWTKEQSGHVLSASSTSWCQGGCKHPNGHSTASSLQEVALQVLAAQNQSQISSGMAAKAFTLIKPASTIFCLHSNAWVSECRVIATKSANMGWYSTALTASPKLLAVLVQSAFEAAFVADCNNKLILMLSSWYCRLHRSALCQLA